METKDLIELLRFAYDHMTFEIPEPDQDSEYDFCKVCGMPEWNHKKNCEGLKWKQQVGQILDQL